MTILTGSDENLIDEDIDSEDIIEGLLTLIEVMRTLTSLLFSYDGLETPHG